MVTPIVSSPINDSPDQVTYNQPSPVVPTTASPSSPVTSSIIPIATDVSPLATPTPIASNSQPVVIAVEPEPKQESTLSSIVSTISSIFSAPVLNNDTKAPAPEPTQIYVTPIPSPTPAPSITITEPTVQIIPAPTTPTTVPVVTAPITTQPVITTPTSVVVPITSTPMPIVTTSPVTTTPTPTPVVTAPITKKIVILNNGTVSGDTYCAGIDGHSWNNELPLDWNGAKCTSAGFNSTATGTPCNVIPGQKTGFKVMCEKSGTGWNGTKQTVYKNDGTVSPTRYCAGVNGKSWGGELPQVWNGAKCVSAGINSTTGVGCDTVLGPKPGLQIVCARTGNGWNGARQTVYRNDGTVSGDRYCGGVGGKSWGGELPQEWNGAKCVSAGINSTTGVSCATIPGPKTGFQIICEKTGLGWKA